MTSFAERYQQALAFKSLDVEEFVDLKFHRPIAATVAALLIPTGATPNAVTFSSLLSGWTGAFFLYRGFFVDGANAPLMWFLAGLFLFGSVILDCVDGQLARALGGGSRVGRILDGFVDVLVLLPTYFIWGFGIKALFGTTWIVIAALGGFSTWIHCIVYDKVKNLYLARTMPEAGGAEGTETLESVRAELAEARESGSLLERFLLWVYVGYLQVQDRFASGSTDKQAHILSQQEIDAFRARHLPTMRLTSILGFGTHMMLIYLAIGLMSVDPRAALAMQVIFATLFNLIMAIVLIRIRAFSAQPAPN